MRDDRNLELQDILKIDGINCKGFGIIPKAVMHDVDLSLEAKTIYAYFCSYAGNGTTAFPCRDTILYHLKMTKDYYYKHFHQLEEQGFLLVERTDTFPFKNIYTLISNPKKFDDKQPEYDKAYSQIKFSGLKSFGFGMIPKAVMIDDRIDIKAKGIYSYFCSFAGSGIAAFPKVEKILYHLKIGRQAYYKYYNQLVSCNYITVIQRNAEGGRFTVSDYYLNESPNSASLESTTGIRPCDDLQDNEEFGLKSASQPCDDLPYIDRPYIDRPYIDRPYIDIQDTNINSNNINNLKKNNQSINLNPRERVSEEDYRHKVYEEMKINKGIPYYFKTDINLMTEAIRILAEWNTFKNGYYDDGKQQIFLLFVDCLIEMACEEKEMIYKGSHVTYAKVIEKINENIVIGENYKFMSIQGFIEELIYDYETASKHYEIKAHVPYMKSCIWNCFMTYKVCFNEKKKKLVNG